MNFILRHALYVLILHDVLLRGEFTLECSFSENGMDDRFDRFPPDLPLDHSVVIMINLNPEVYACGPNVYGLRFGNINAR